MPAMRRDEAGAGLAAAAFLDLTVNDIVTVEKKKITVIKELPDSLVYLEDLYTYLKEKSRHMEKMMTDFYAGSRNKKLAEKIGESLCKDGAAVEEKGGLFVPKRVFIPEKAYKDELIGMIRSAVREEEKKDPLNKQLANMIDYVSDMTAVMAVVIVTSMN